MFDSKQFFRFESWVIKIRINSNFFESRVLFIYIFKVRVRID